MLIHEAKYMQNLQIYGETFRKSRKYTLRGFSECGRIINVLRSVAGSDSGADRESMMIYRAIIRSIIDYGWMANSSIAPKIITKTAYCTS